MQVIPLYAAASRKSTGSCGQKQDHKAIMPNSTAALSAIHELQGKFSLRWVNTGRVSDDWKARIFEAQPSGRQIALYNRSKSITILLEHRVEAISGVTELPRRPGGGAVKVAASNFSTRPGVCYEVESTTALVTLLCRYFEKPEPEILSPELAPDDFDAQIRRSLADTPENRRDRLKNANPIPTRVVTRTTVFVRNPDVVAEVLLRACGLCEDCGSPAPFRRASDGSPYLEVHHKVALAMGGEDTVANAIGLCPNCHRRVHFGRKM